MSKPTPHVARDDQQFVTINNIEYPYDTTADHFAVLAKMRAANVDSVERLWRNDDYNKQQGTPSILYESTYAIGDEVHVLNGHANSPFAGRIGKFIQWGILVGAPIDPKTVNDDAYAMLEFDDGTIKCVPRWRCARVGRTGCTRRGVAVVTGGGQ